MAYACPGDDTYGHPICTTMGFLNSAVCVPTKKAFANIFVHVLLTKALLDNALRRGIHLFCSPVPPVPGTGTMVPMDSSCYPSFG